MRNDAGHSNDSKAATRKRLLVAALLPLGFSLQLLGAFFPNLVENAFSRGLGRWSQTLIGMPVGLAPFSVAEILLVALGALGIYRLVAGIQVWRRREASLKSLLWQGLQKLLATAGALYLYFVLAWGLNYARPSFATNAGWSEIAPKEGELAQLVTQLIERCNLLRAQLNEDEQGHFLLTTGKAGLEDKLPRAFEQLAASYPFLDGPKPILRTPLISPWMTKVGIAGIFSPFTGESHVNAGLPDASFTFAACHEVAHRRGVAREDEANFVAYKACVLSGDPELQYPGYLIAYAHALNELLKENRSLAKELHATLSEAVLKDRAQIAAFWSTKTKFEGTLRVIGTQTNNLYLKAQQQKEGTRSYGHVVKLLLTDARQQ